MGQTDLAAGLNKLGAEGWELAGIEPATAANERTKELEKPAQFYFKRPRVRQPSLDELRSAVAKAETDVELWKDRVSWTERMARRGFLSEGEVRYEREQLKLAQAVLEKAQVQLRLTQRPPPRPPTDERRP